MPTDSAERRERDCDEYPMLSTGLGPLLAMQISVGGRGSVRHDAEVDVAVTDEEEGIKSVTMSPKRCHVVDHTRIVDCKMFMISILGPTYTNILARLRYRGNWSEHIMSSVAICRPYQRGMNTYRESIPHTMTYL